jgi:hypothetical protein
MRSLKVSLTARQSPLLFVNEKPFRTPFGGLGAVQCDAAVIRYFVRKVYTTGL